MKNYENLTKECEALIRSGRDKEVAKLIREIAVADVPRKWRLPLANISRRISENSLGLRLLSSVVRPPEDLIKVEPRPSELAEYAVLLQRCGARHEALAILEPLDPQVTPEALLYRAFCHFNGWEYEEAEPLLRHYLALPLNPYSKLIGHVNLASALIETERFDEAELILLESAETAKSKQLHRLEGNSLELLAYIYTLKNAYPKAESALRKAEERIDNHRSVDRLFVDKCRAILNSRRAGSPEALLELRKKALLWPHPETVRELDLHLLELKFDTPRFEHLYFGTPSKSYRDRIIRRLARTPDRDFYEFGNGSSIVLDIVSGEGPVSTQLRSGGIQHKVLEVLTRDFYRPVRIGALFGALYPDEYFNSSSSFTRVHQALRRTRAWINTNDLPLTIVEKDGSYAIRFEQTGHFAFRVPLERSSLLPFEKLFLQLVTQYGDAEFSAQTARADLQLSLSMFQRFISWAEKNGKVHRHGAGRTTLYHVAN